MSTRRGLCAFIAILSCNIEYRSLTTASNPCDESKCRNIVTPQKPSCECMVKRTFDQTISHSSIYYSDPRYHCWAQLPQDDVVDKGASAVDRKSNSTANLIATTNDVASADMFACAPGFEGRPIPNETKTAGDSNIIIKQYYTCCPKDFLNNNNNASKNNLVLTRECSSEMCPESQCFGDKFMATLPCHDQQVYSHARIVGHGLIRGSVFQYTCCTTPSNDAYEEEEMNIWIQRAYNNSAALLALSIFLVISISIVLAAMLRSKDVRSQAFNVYLIFLLVPALVLCVFLVVKFTFYFLGMSPPICSVVYSIRHFYAASNIWLNAIVAHHCFVLLRNSKNRLRSKPPKMKLVFKQVAIVYFGSVGYAALESALKCEFLLSDSWNAQTIGFMTADSVLSFLVLVPPFGYFLYVCYRILRGQYFPKHGRTRVLALYFLRITATFVVVWIPVVILELVSTHSDKAYISFYINYPMVVGELLSLAMMLTKPDVAVSVKQLFSCCCNSKKKKGGDDDVQAGGDDDSGDSIEVMGNEALPGGKLRNAIKKYTLSWKRSDDWDGSALN